MDRDAQEEIKMILAILRHSLIKNGVSIGISKKYIMFFDTDNYVRAGKLDGFKVPMDNLVK